MLLDVLIAAVVVMLASIVGVVFIGKTAKKFLESRLTSLVSFSAGVFLVTAGALALEVFELVDNIWLGVILILIGYVLASLLYKLLPETHHHHSPECNKSHRAAKKLLIGDAIHNIADGTVLVVAFSVSPALGLAATVSIFIHEALQEVSEFFVLRQAGYSTKKALTLNFLVSTTILIGVGFGYLAVEVEGLEKVLLALSAGFFTNVVVHDLLPKRHEHEHSGSFFKQLTLVFIGLILMSVIQAYFNEGHTHGGDGHGHENHDEQDEHNEGENH